jgi:hypothetical protein
MRLAAYTSPPERQTLPPRPKPGRIASLARLARVYALRSTDSLSFWREQPQLNERSFQDGRQYFLRLQRQAGYRGPFDQDGVPLVDYHGDIGLQYNPVTIAQYGLAHFNRWCDTRASIDERAWLAAATWLELQLTPNRAGVPVWMHEFDWEYRGLLQAPWYSGLAQGLGVSLLIRAADATGEWRFAKTAHQAFKVFNRDISAGGVVTKDARGRTWLEEFVVDKPGHVLSGFVTAAWAVLDYARFTNAPEAKKLFRACVSTIETALPAYDTGHWSLYELSTEGRPMPANRDDHQLHIVQLRALERVTGRVIFRVFADCWQRYLDSRVHRTRALMEKATFRLLHS